MQQIHHPGEMPQLLDYEGYHRYAFHWGEDPPPPGFSSIGSINKMLYDTPGMVLLLVLTAV
jgi:hypothetical protein